MFWIYGKQLWWHNMNEIITECNDGTFGYDCKNNCSGHCSNNNPCIKQTGHCNGGCKSGYTNVFCDESKYYITTLYSTHLWRQISLYTCFKENIFFSFMSTQNAHLDTMEMGVETFVTGTVWTMKYVATSMEFVLLVVKVGTSENTVTIVSNTICRFWFFFSFCLNI